MKIIFSHGKESGPWGTKIKYLAGLAKGLGCEVDSIDYRGIDDPDVRVQKLVTYALNETRGYTLVGSSMGGYVSLIAASALKAKGMFLLAPALYMPGYETKDYSVNQENISIVHGWNDDVIPWQNSLRLAEQNQSELHILKSDHRLIDVLDDIGQLFKHYLSSQVN